MKRLLPLLVILILALTAGALAASRDESLAIARKQVPEAAQLTESDSDDGIFEFEFRDDSARYDVAVRALDGAVLEVETGFTGIPRAADFLLTADEAAGKAGISNADLILPERDDAGAVYEIFVSKDGVRQTITLNAETAQTIRTETYPAASDALTADAIARIVSEKQPGAELTELELEPTDGGRYVYDGEARVDGREFSFEINAANGKFIEWEIDD